MINQKDIELRIKPKCSKCNSSQTYLRISTMERICRSCGNIEPTEIEVKTKK
jgi:ribosomal protein S27E